jgi:hypothetical protein
LNVSGNEGPDGGVGSKGDGGIGDEAVGGLEETIGKTYTQGLVKGRGQEVMAVDEGGGSKVSLGTRINQDFGR